MYGALDLFRNRSLARCIAAELDRDRASLGPAFRLRLANLLSSNIVDDDVNLIRQQDDGADGCASQVDPSTDDVDGREMDCVVTRMRLLKVCSSCNS